MIAPAKFWDKMAPRYAKRKISNIPAYQASLDRIGSNLNATDQVLEIGCGTGSTALLLAPLVKHITGTDISSGMIEIANAKVPDAKVANVTFRRLDIEQLHTAEPQYDAVIALNLLHLVLDLEKTLRHAHAQVASGGLFISKTVCMGESWSIWPMVLPLAQILGKAPLVHFFKITELEGAIENAGFKIIETGNFPANPPSRLIVARKLE